MSVTIKNCASDIATNLNGQTLGGVTLATGENLFAYPLPYPPVALAVEVLNVGGGELQPLISTTDAANAIASVQILIHAGPGSDGFEQGEALGRAILGAMQQNVLSGYHTVVARESAPTWVGVDPSTQRNAWSINLEAKYAA